MKSYRYIILSDSDNLAIINGIKNGKTHHFRERCRAIDFSNKGQKVPQIAFLLEKRCETIRHWFDKWEQQGLCGLDIQTLWLAVQRRTTFNSIPTWTTVECIRHYE